MLESLHSKGIENVTSFELGSYSKSEIHHNR